MSKYSDKKTLVHKWHDGQKLSIWHIGKVWSWCHEEDGKEDRVGGMYPTKDALLIDAKEYLAQWGL